MSFISYVICILSQTILMFNDDNELLKKKKELSNHELSKMWEYINTGTSTYNSKEIKNISMVNTQKII